MDIAFPIAPARPAFAAVIGLLAGLARKLRHLLWESATIVGMPDARTIEVSAAQADQLAAVFRVSKKRPPSRAELRVLIDDFIKEEVYYREALALGLDRDDPVIRRRLRRKMEDRVAARADLLMPSEETLRRHYAAHPERFQPPFDVIRETVEDNWRRETAAAAERRAYHHCRSHYRIVRPDMGGLPTEI
jgi:hypothetical protein